MIGETPAAEIMGNLQPSKRKDSVEGNLLPSRYIQPVLPHHEPRDQYRVDISYDTDDTAAEGETLAMRYARIALGIWDRHILVSQPV